MYRSACTGESVEQCIRVHCSYTTHRRRTDVLAGRLAATRAVLRCPVLSCVVRICAQLPAIVRT